VNYLSKPVCRNSLDRLYPASEKLEIIRLV
jgi:hypothetical protein